MSREPIPRLPVFGWQALTQAPGAVPQGLPCLLDLPRLHYTTSGRASILLALEALDVGPGDRVLLPSYHCPTMVAPTAHLQALPVFYPIDDGGAADLEWLDRQDLAGVRVLLAAHYFGAPQPMAAIRRWCNERDIALIEDCAHALFGRSDGRTIGAWGDIAIASLTKFMPMPEGGCMVINRDARPPRLNRCPVTAHLKAGVDILEVGARQGQLAGLNGLISGTLDGLRRLRGQRGSPAAQAPGRGPDPDATGADFTIDSSLAHRAPALPCRWMAHGLPRPRIVERRRAHFELLQHRLAGHIGLRPLLAGLPADCAPYVFPLWVDRPDPGYAELRRLAMPVFRWDRLWPEMSKLPGDPGLRWSHHVLQLACHQDLSEAQLDRFVDTLLRLFAGAGSGA